MCMRKFVRVFFCAALLLVVFCRHTVAATIQPDSVNLDIQRGERAHQTVTIENDTAEPEEYRMSVSGISFGESADDLRFEPLSSTQSTWIKLDQPAFTLEPYSARNVEVTVEVPADVEVEQLNFAVLATVISNNQAGVGVTSALASLFFVDIGEQAPVDLRLDSFENITANSHVRPLKFAVLVSNLGVSTAQPQVGLVVKNMFGRQVEVINLNPTGRRVPGGTSRVFAGDWTGGPWRLGVYTVDALVFPDDSGRELSASTRVVLFSWPTVLILGLAIITIGTLGRYFSANSILRHSPQDGE